MLDNFSAVTSTGILEVLVKERQSIDDHVLFFVSDDDVVVDLNGH